MSWREVMRWSRTQVMRAPRLVTCEGGLTLRDFLSLKRASSPPLREAKGEWSDGWVGGRIDEIGGKEARQTYPNSRTIVMVVVVGCVCRCVRVCVVGRELIKLSRKKEGDVRFFTRRFCGEGGTRSLFSNKAFVAGSLLLLSRQLLLRRHATDRLFCCARLSGQLWHTKQDFGPRFMTPTLNQVDIPSPCPANLPPFDTTLCTVCKPHASILVQSYPAINLPCSL